MEVKKEVMNLRVKYDHRQWTLSTWLLYHGEWDCVDVHDMDAMDVAAKVAENTANYGARRPNSTRMASRWPSSGWTARTPRSS